MSIGSAAILCRQCGAPVHGVEGGADACVACSHCGERTPIDDAVRDRLRRHLARVRRADQKARTILRERIFAGVLPGLMARAKLVMALSLVGLLLVAPIVMVLGAMLFMWASEKDEPVLMLVAAVVLLLDLVLALVAFPAGLYVAWRMAKSADLDASRSAHAAEALASTTSPARCGQCGGHAQVVVIGDGFASRCPWCDAPLTAAAGDAARAAAEAVIAAQREEVDANLRRARMDAGLEETPRYRTRIDGFELRGGIHEGWIDGARVWIAFDALESGVVRRLELDRETRLPGAVWFVRSAAARAHADAATAFRLERPGVDVARDAGLSPWFGVFAEPAVDVRGVASVPAVRDVLVSLGEGECLHLDPAGASCWKVGGRALGGTGAVATMGDRARALVRVTGALGS